MGGYDANAADSAGFGYSEAVAGGGGEGFTGGSAAPEGSASWWTSEIASREAEAAANTLSSPSGDSGMANAGFYQDPRTGEMYANKTQFLAQNPTGVSVPVWSTPGISVVTPSGDVFQSRYSQYWMDPAYTGVEPSLAEKAAYSTADYARDFAGALLDQYGTTAAPVVQAKAVAYRSPSTPAATRTVQQQLEDLGVGDIVGQGISWLKNNILIVVIVIAGIFVLPRLADAALPARRR